MTRHCRPASGRRKPSRSVPGWYAQDADGNLWYLGEDTTEYENGKPKTKEGSWEAGVDGALPGIIMRVDPQVRMTYREEYYKGHAEDGASIIGTDARAKIPYGRLEHGVQTRNFNGIEPDVIEERIHAKGIGVVLEITVSGGSDRAELQSYGEGLRPIRQYMPASGPRSIIARVTALSCQGTRPWLRASAASDSVLAIQKRGSIT